MSEKITTTIFRYAMLQSEVDIAADKVTCRHYRRYLFRDWFSALAGSMNSVQRDASLPHNAEEFLSDLTRSLQELGAYLNTSLSDTEWEKVEQDTKQSLQGYARDVFAITDKLQPVIDTYIALLMKRFVYRFPEALCGDFLPVESVEKEKPNTDYFVMIKPPRDASVEQFIRWETLRRTIECNGGRTIVDETNYQEGINKLQRSYIFGRDLMVHSEGILYLPDNNLISIARNEIISVDRQQVDVMKTMVATGLIRTLHMLPDGDLSTEELQEHRKIQAEKWRQRIPDLSGQIFMGGNVVFDRANRKVYVGHSVHPAASDEEIIGEIEKSNAERMRWVEQLNYQVIDIPVPYTLKDAYHLDTFWGVLPKGEIIFNPHHLPPKFLERCRQCLSGASKIIEVSEADKDLLLTNIVIINDQKIIFAGNSETMKRHIEELGYEAIMPTSVGVNLDWNEKAAGPRCMTLGALRREQFLAATRR